MAPMLIITLAITNCVVSLSLIKYQRAQKTKNGGKNPRREHRNCYKTPDGTFAEPVYFTAGFFSVQISIRDTDTCDIRDAFTIKSRLRCQLTEKCSPCVR